MLDADSATDSNDKEVFIFPILYTVSRDAAPRVSVSNVPPQENTAAEIIFRGCEGGQEDRKSPHSLVFNLCPNTLQKAIIDREDMKHS